MWNPHRDNAPITWTNELAFLRQLHDAFSFQEIEYLFHIFVLVAFHSFPWRDVDFIEEYELREFTLNFTRSITSFLDVHPILSRNLVGRVIEEKEHDIWARGQKNWREKQGMLGSDKANPACSRHSPREEVIGGKAAAHFTPKQWIHLIERIQLMNFTGIAEFPIWLFVTFVALLCFVLSGYLTFRRKKVVVQETSGPKHRLPRQAALILGTPSPSPLPSLQFCPACGKPADIFASADTCGFCGQSMVPRCRRQTRRFFAQDIGVIR